MGQVLMPITSNGRAPEQLTAAATLRCEADVLGYAGAIGESHADEALGEGDHPFRCSAHELWVATEALGEGVGLGVGHT